MEYKSELIDFEKEDAESKKHMLGSDKAIEEIKKRIQTFDSIDEEFCVNNEEVLYLLSIIEQHDKALERLQSKAYIEGHNALHHEIIKERVALQAIRK